jgi:hypothetical protein
VSDGTQAPSVGLILEKYIPVTLGVFGFFVNAFWIKFALLDHPEWGNRLLDRVIQAASVGVAFWGIAITLFIGMESKPIFQTLRKLGYLRLIVNYFWEALLSTLLLLSLSVLLEPLSKKFSPLVLSSLWIALGVWALVTTFRTYMTLRKILVRVE